MKYDKYEVKEVETLRRMMRDLATVEWQGKDITSKRLIFEARKLCGWSKKEQMR